MTVLRNCVLFLVGSTVVLGQSCGVHEDLTKSAQATAERKDPVRGGTEDTTNAMNQTVWVGGCSGTLVANGWVLTANHCIEAGTTPGTIDIQLGRGTAAVQQSFVAPGGIFRRPCNEPTQLCEDAILLRLANPFSISGATEGFARSQWPNSSSDLATRTILQIGFGGTDAGDSLQRTADLGVTSVDVGRVYESIPRGDVVNWSCHDTDPICILGGDSGGGGFVDLNGRTFQTTIQAGGGLIPDGGTTPGYFALATSTPVVRAWLDKSLYTHGYKVSGNVQLNGNGQGYGGYGGGVAVSKRDLNALDAFWVDGTTGTLMWRAYANGGWSGSQSLGAPTGRALTGRPASVSWSVDRIDVFVRATDDTIWQRYWTNSGWASGWFWIASGVTSSPAVASWGPGRLDLLVRGWDSAIWHLWYQGGWGNWTNLGGPSLAAPAAVSSNVGRLDLVVVGTDRRLWHKWCANSSCSTAADWSLWSSAGGPETETDPAIASWGPGRLDLYVRENVFEGLWHRWYENVWLDTWINMGIQAPACGLSAVSWGPGRVDVFSCSGGAIWQTYFPSPSSCSHSECNAGTRLVSGCSGCATTVCNSDSYCCDVQWDSICVGEAQSLCGLFC